MNKLLSDAMVPIVFIHPLYGVFDLMESPALNMMQHSGSHGCSVCLHPGGASKQNAISATRTHALIAENAAYAVTIHVLSWDQRSVYFSTSGRSCGGELIT